MSLIPKNVFRASLAGSISLALAGCISLGAEPPEQLLTLTSTASGPMSLATDGQLSNALLIEEPDAPQRLAVTRVPVKVNDSSIAYLKEAVWVERPSRLFRRLLAETVRAKSNRLVMERDDPTVVSAETLGGTLREFGYDADNRNVVVSFDAMRTMAGGRIETRRFESTVPNVEPEAVPVGAALNVAANDVAEQVANWII